MAASFYNPSIRPDESESPGQVQMHRTPKRDVPFVPTDGPVVTAMMKFADVGPDDVVYDLGCGDGRLVVAAAVRGARHAIGVDIDPQRIREGVWNAQKHNVAHKTTWIKGSFFDVDISGATVVFTYLLSAINRRLSPKFLWELRPGTRIVSNYFEMGDWKPDAQIETHTRILHKWIVPAWVQGDWRCVVDAPHGRRHLRLHLTRSFQHVGGTAQVGRSTVPVLAGRLWGSQLTFGLPDPDDFTRPATRYEATYDGTYLRGTLRPPRSAESQPIHWAGTRFTQA